MTRLQQLGLALILISGGLSQFTTIKQSQWGVWIMAVLAIVGMVLVLYEWFKTWR